MMDSGERGSSGKRKLFSLLCHGSIFLGSLLFTSAIPLVVLLLFKATAKETLNYHFNIWLYGAISAGLISFFTVLFFTIPLAVLIAGALGLFTLVPPIFGILATLNNPDEPYRYPFIWRIL
jgi:uncharacterized protein